MALTISAHNKTKAWFRDMIAYGTYTIGNAVTQMPIHSLTLTGDVITLQFYLAETVAGTITKFQVIDKDGEVWDDQPDSIVKPALNGLLVTFKYTLTRV
ncbi:hypothetical protein NST99_20285 [Paenibacillus sp. FSL L8-0470]|uniref:hypothetical protein n=1 Tax=Paenibacillus sp. FSL L8-0470 TaxID=2954688 RepID=UPI0030F5E181